MLDSSGRNTRSGYCANCGLVRIDLDDTDGSLILAEASVRKLAAPPLVMPGATHQCYIRQAQKSLVLPNEQLRSAMRDAVSEDNFRTEFLNDLPPALTQLISPDLWQLHWSLTTPRRKGAMAELLFDLRANRT